MYIQYFEFEVYVCWHSSVNMSMAYLFKQNEHLPTCVLLKNLMGQMLMEIGNEKLSLNTAISKKHQIARNKSEKGWLFTGILHIDVEEMHKFVFLHVKNLFFLSGGYSP